MSGLKTHKGNQSFNKLSFWWTLTRAGFQRQGNDKKSHQMAQTCELSANSLVEDVGLYHLMLSGDMPKILGVKKRQRESPWSRKQSHVTCTTKAYLSVTGRFIEQSWQMQPCTPETVAELHTADRISDDWGITNNVHTLCANSGAGMVQTTEDFRWLCWVLPPQKQGMSGWKEQIPCWSQRGRRL